MAKEAEKPAVLIIGGLGMLFSSCSFIYTRRLATECLLMVSKGFTGRWLAYYIHKNNLASEVRLVDKVLPQLAWLAPEFSEACSQDKFMQADATRERMSPPNYCKSI